MRYVISDLHFGHDSILEYCQRPFDDVREMNNEIVSRWNAVVDEKDTVVLVGDVRHHPDMYSTAYWLDQLNGRVLLVRGNHDSDVGQNSVVNVVESCTIQHGRYDFYVEHQPVGASCWQIHGHSHNNDLVTYPFIHPNSQRVNVSADVIGFEPLRMDRLVGLLDRRKRYATIEDV